MWLLALAGGVASVARAEELAFVETLKHVPVAFAEEMGISPDGLHVYVAGDNSVSVFARDLSTGAVDYLATYREDENGLSGLEGARAVAFSPEGRHVYVASQFGGPNEGTVGVFERDPATGMLTWLQTEPTRGADEFHSYSILASPDGRHVYVSHADFSSFPENDLLAVYERDENTGRLTYAETQVSGIDRPDNRLQFVGSLAMSPDGLHLYSASLSGGLAVFVRDPETGGLTFAEAEFEAENGVSCLDEPRSVSLSPDGSHVYVASSSVGSQAEGGIVVFWRQQTSGELSFMECLRESDVEGLGSLDALTISRDGRRLYAVTTGESGDGEEGEILVLERDQSTGSLTFVEMLVTGAASVGDIGGSFHVLLSPDERFLYTASRKANMGVFARDTESGALSFVEAFRFEPIDDVQGLRVPFAVEVSPDGRDVYVASFSDEAITHFARDSVGALTFVGASFDGVDGVEGLDSVNELAISSDGRHVYALNTIDGQVVVFEREAEAGGLTFLQAIETGRFARDFVLSPDDCCLYVGVSSNPALYEYSRDSSTGLLSLVGTINRHLPFGARRVAIRPDGRFLYVGGRDTLATVSLDSQSSDLGSVKSLPAIVVEDIAVSPDGRHVVTAERAGSLFNAVVVYVWDEAFNRLGLLEFHRDGAEGVEGLAGPISVAFSPDGERVYAAGREDHTITVFARDRESGHLTFLGAHVNGEAGVDGLLAPQAMAMSSDGLSLYAVSRWQHAVTTFGARLPCVPGPQTMCLNAGRFRVEVEWRDGTGETGPGQVVLGTLAGDSGLFWFFSPANWEMLVKVLDGCAINDRFWVFAGATTDVAYTLTVTDIHTGQSKSYPNPLGSAADSITDTGALAVCSAQR